MSKIISKIQFIIYSFFAFVLSLIIISVASLSYGITIPLIILPNFKAEQLYIKLDKKLILEAKELHVTLSNDKISTTPLIKTPKVTPIIEFVRKNFSKVAIDKLVFGKNIVTFSYTDNPKQRSDNSMSFKGNDVDALVFFEVHDTYVTTKIGHFIHTPTKITISGAMVYDFETELSSSKIKLAFSDCAKVDMYIKENTQRLAFTAESNSFVDIRPIVKLFGLQHSITKWIVDYNSALSFKLVEAKGIHEYNNNKLLLETLFLAAKERDVSYTFNETLSPVTAKEVDISFTKGILDIKPKHAFYNEHLIDGGGVKIDFNHEHVLLDVDLDLHTRASQDVIDIVKAYEIPLPLVQKTGKAKGHIALHVDLRTEEAYAKAQFFVKDSQIELDGYPYHIKHASIRLNKSFLSVDSGEVSYKDIIKAEVNGGIELKELIGDFYYNTDYIKLDVSDKHTINLAKKMQIHVRYTKEQEETFFNTSQWKFDDTPITLQKGSLTTDSKFGSAFKVNNLHFNIKEMFEAKVEGNFDLNKGYSNLEVDLFNIDYKDFNISSKETLKTKIILDKNITHIQVLNKNTFQIKNHTLTLLPTRLRLKNDYLDVYGADVSLENNISTELSVHYELGTKRAQFNLENTQLFSEEFVFIGPKFKLNYEYLDNKHYFSAPTLDLHLELNKKGSSTTRLNDLSKILPYSPLLKSYLLKEGAAKVYYRNNVFEMLINLKNFPPLLSKNGKNITEYSMRGSFRQGSLRLLINNSVDLRYKDKVNVKMHDIDFNLYPILGYIEKIGKKSKKSDLELSIKTQACNVTLSDLKRTILADTIEIDIKQDKIDAKLSYKEGGVLFQSEGDEFTVFGKSLNDTFMNELFRFSTFEKGSLSFSAYGSFDHYTTLMNIDETTIKDYTILNNTLAFFNTIPALVTFSVPGYSKSGLHISNGYISFDMNNSIATIKDAKLTSKELIITSEGTLDLEEDKVDMLMQVKTDIGSSAKNIPLVGYIIFGDETVSTTVHVHGDLQNPEVDNAAATSVIVAPYNILKRTITLPLKWFDDIFTKEETEDKKK